MVPALQIRKQLHLPVKDVSHAQAQKEAGDNILPMMPVGHTNCSDFSGEIIWCKNHMAVRSR